MKRFAISFVFLALLATAWISSNSARSNAATTGISGQGKMKFKVLYTSSHLPAEAQKRTDQRPWRLCGRYAAGKRRNVFSLKGAGIIQVAGDMKSTRLLDTPAEVKNTQRTTQRSGLRPMALLILNFPATKPLLYSRRPWMENWCTRCTRRKAVHDLGYPVANDYFAGQGNFVPTDVRATGRASLHHNGLLQS
jgi:hypothetical protein